MGSLERLRKVRAHMNSREQFDMLGTVSNYHALGFPSLRDAQKIKTPNISLYEHIAMLENKRYLPASPCNHINLLYQIKGKGTSEKLHKILGTVRSYSSFSH